jgi:hypothetical protein
MPNTTHTLHTPAATLLAALALACFGLGACGESSGGGSSQTSAATSAVSLNAKTRSAQSTATAKPRSGAVTSGKPQPTGIRACLEKSGAIAKGASVAGSFALKGPKRAQLQAALKKCSGGRFPGAAAGPAPGRVNSSAFRHALAGYSACLRQNGVNMPAPNTSGKGPVFSTKGVNTRSPQFRSATLKCRGVLISAFRAKR